MEGGSCPDGLKFNQQRHLLLWSVNYRNLCTDQFAFDYGSAKRKVTAKSHVTMLRLCQKSRDSGRSVAKAT